MIALISITTIQLIIDIIMYQQMQQQKKSIDIKIQRYRQEQLELIHQHQEWITATQREVQRKPLVRQSTTTQDGRTVLQEEYGWKTEEKNRVTV